MNFHPRPHIVERSEYVPTSEAEIPMIRVINQFVNDFFSRHDMKGWKVLDAGCGRQPFRKRFEAAGCSYSSMDVNQNPEGSVQFVCAIDEPLPDTLLQSGPFDLIFCLEVLEHVADWDAAFGNFNTLLKKGGRLVITAPHFFYLHEEPYDFWRPTCHAFEYFGNRHGLTVSHFRKGGNAMDILETILGSERIYPKNMNFMDRGFAYLLRKSVRFTRSQFIERLMKKKFEVIPTYYLSNQVELMKV